MKIHNMYTAIDCENPRVLADFYAAITGYELKLPASDVAQVWLELIDSNQQVKIAFQKITNYQAPTWPEGDPPQQMHLDFIVDDLSKAELEVLTLGATKAEFQPGSPPHDEYEYEFRVYLDPEGHPFCLIASKH